MKKLLYAFSALALLFASCSSDSDSSSDDSSSSVLPTTMVETDFNGDVYTTTFTYNGNKMVKTTDNEGYYEKYFYTGDLITKVEFYNDMDELEQTELFTYNGSQQLTTFQRLAHYNETGSKEIYTYTMSGVSVSFYEGDLISQTNATGTGTISFSNGEISEITTNFGSSTTRTFTYDSKNNPFKNILGMDKISISSADVSLQGTGVNYNVLTDVQTDDIEERSTTYSYTYNANNYPLTCNETDSVLGNSSFQFIYE